MKANEAPNKIILSADRETMELYDEWVVNDYTDNIKIEYTRTDAFMKKMARFLENKLYDRVEIQVFGTVIPSLTSKKAFIEEFTNYMKGE